jgi:hypothetical protein
LDKFNKTATVEAEFGKFVVEGSEITLAHHDIRSSNPAPCLRDNQVVAVEAIGFSHFDLDAFGGFLSIISMKPDSPSFWKLVGFVDVHGPHKISKAGASEQDILRLNSWWAWSQDHRFQRIPREDVLVLSVEDLKEEINALSRILAGDKDLLDLGRSFIAVEDTLNRGSLEVFKETSGVILRSCGEHEFVNHLYSVPDGRIGVAVVGYNEGRKSITVSFADPIEGLTAVKFMQDFFGPEAGGNPGIAGSPRGIEYEFEVAEKVATELSRVIIAS